MNRENGWKGRRSENQKVKRSEDREKKVKEEGRGTMDEKSTRRKVQGTRK
jgi:hypothetical protein